MARGIYVFVLLLAFCLEEGLAQVQFAPRVPYPVSGSTFNLEYGDLNGDMNSDFVVLNGDYLSVFIGNGDGTFVQMPDIDVAGTATDLVVKDLSGDLIPDLAVTMAGYSVLTFLGDGLGNFTISQVLPTTGVPSQIVATDFDGDALQDLAVATDGVVHIFRAVSLFNYGAASTVTAGTFPIDLVAADFNGDSNVDLAVQNRDSYDVTILLGTGAGTFNFAQTISQLSGSGLTGQLICDDFDGDMIPDLLSSNGFEIIWIKGLGNGTFDPAISVGGGENISICDFNSDGIKDFGSSSSYNNSVSFYSGNGDGSFTAIPTIVGIPGPRRFLITDINHDARPDIVSSSGSTSAFYVLLGVPVTPYFNPAATTDHSTGGFTRSRIITADISGDGNIDIITTNAGNIAVLYGTGLGCFSSPRTFPSSGNVMDIFAADLNADGKADLVAANGTDLNISVFLSNATGFAPRVEYSTGPGTAGSQSLTVADVDVDGKMDVITVNNNPSGTISILRGNGDGTFNPYTQYAVDPGPSAIAVGDVNGDLKPDLVVACPSSYTANILLNDGSGGFPTYTAISLNRPSDVVLIDFNHDSHRDILYSTTNGLVAGLLLNDGSGGFPTDTGFYVPGLATPGTLRAGDFDGDGNVDIVAGGPLYNKIASIIFGDGLGGFRSIVSYPTGAYNLIQDVAAGDFDEDGKSDFAVLASDFFSNAAITTYRTAPAACTPPPAISSISPSSGAAGTVVSIFGNGFDDLPANNIVRFNGVPATVNTSNCCFLSVVVPLGASTGNLTVQVGSITTFNPVIFAVPAPTITNFTPTLGTTGESITITGTNFSPVQAINVVQFNGTVATVTASSSTSITVTVPSGATTGPITVTVDGRTATSGSNFTFVFPPTISSFSPGSGPPGTTVTITGANFDPVTANNTVRINGALMTVTSSTATSIVADIPGSAISGLITVTVMGYTATTITNFQVITPAPTITGFSPATGPVGTTVTITGTNFNLVPVNNIVRFGAVGATVSSVTATTMQVNVPAGATYNPISLTINEFQCESKVPFITTFESFQTIDINSFTPMTPGGSPSRRAVSGDINGDGTIDFVAAMMDFPVYNLRVFSGSQFVNLPTAVSNLVEALHDINGDGKPDLLAVTGNGFGNTLHIFKNTSVPGIINSGTFAPRVDLAYGNSTRILIKDIDGDGRPDVVRSQNTPAFVIHKNSSQFGVIDATTLATQVTVATSSNITIADGGDIDGDGKPDLVTTGGSFFRNTSTPGTISFDPKQDLISGTVVFALADINRDEKLDVIGNNGVLLNTSVPGTFSFAPLVSISITSPFSVKVADLDGDGLPDLAYAANRISVVKNTSTPTTASFLPKVDFGDTYDYIGTNLGGGLHSILDIDGDGKQDLLYINGGYIINALITGSPPKVPIVSGFSPASGPIGTTVTIGGSNFSATPLNNIVYFGAVRAMVTSCSPTSISVTVPPGVTDQPISVTVNGFTGYSAKPFTPLFNTDGIITASSFASPISYGAWSSPLGLSIGDVNADGKPDIASADAAGSAVSVFQNNTTMGAFNATSLLPLVAFNSGAGPSEVELVDMDGDGKLDLASTCDTPSLPNGRVSVNRNITGTGTINPSFFSGAAQSLANFRAFGLAVGDIDGDGKPEMAAVTLTENRAHVYKNFNLGTVKSSYRENLAILTSYWASSVTLSDIDVDGKLDLIVTYDGPFISIFRNTSTIGLINPNSFGPRIDIPVPFTTGFARIAIGDIDGDGRPDIVKPNPGNNSISIFKNISTPGSITIGSFDLPFALSTGLAPSSAALGDLDGDGKREIAVTNETSNTFSLFKNVSVLGTLDASSFLPKVDFVTPAGPRRIAIGDLDGDTKPDLVVSCPGADLISIFHNDKVLLGGGVPTITSFSPTSAAAGATVTITGTNFIGATTVSFGGTTASSFTVNSPTSIDAVVGAGSSGIVSVTTPGGTGTLTGFAFLVPPTITGFTPSSGPIGTTVTITGTNFDPTPGNNLVKFNGTTAAVTSGSTTSLIVTVPGGATTGPITVTVAGNTATSAGDFTVVPPGTIVISPQPISTQVCDGVIATFSTSATGTTNLVYQWQKFDGSAYANISDGGGFSGTSTTSLSINTTGSFGAGDYRCKVSGDFAPDVFSNVATLTVNPIPGPPTLPVGGSSCGPGTVTVSVSGASPGEYRWYTTATGGTAIAGEQNAFYTISPLAATTTYYAAINIASCESASRTPVVGTVNTVPLSAGAVPSFRCGPGTVTLGATGEVNGNYRWYAGAVGGLPLVGEVNNTFVTPSISTTTSYFVSLHNGTCETVSRTEVIATINPVPVDPPAPTVTGPFCSGSSFTFSTSGASPGEYRWYTVPTGGTAIAGATGDSYSTILTTTANPTYYVSVVIGGCESGRQSTTATVIPLPLPPNASNPPPACTGDPAVLTASGSVNGNYRWYDGTTLITGEVNGAYTTPALTSNRTFGVSIHDGTCESPVVTLVASVQTCSPPVVVTQVSAPFVPGIIRINLSALLSDPENNLDITTLQIVSGLPSGATATIDGTDLVIDYSGMPFPGIETIVIEVCDLTGKCTIETLTLNLSTEISIFNAISPNADGKNETFFIENIDLLPETQQNKLTLFNRWGSIVFEAVNYNNTNNAFRGLGKNGEELPSGTYYYSLEFSSGAPKRTGFISLKR